MDTTNLVAALTLTDSKRGTVTESEATYVNPVIRAQRLSDGALKSFPAAGLKAALEAWAGSSSVAAQAYDASGNGTDYLQATVDSQPLVVDSGTVVTDANGNVALSPDGVDDFLNISSLSVSKPLTFFAVVDASTVSSVKMLFDAPSGGRMGIFANGDTQRLVTIGTNINGSLAGLDDDDGVHVWSARYKNGSGSFVRSDGVSTGDADATAVAAPTSLNLFADNAGARTWPTKVSAFFIFEDLTDVQIAAIEAAIAAEYGITLA